jgi:hypothetical protein
VVLQVLLHVPVGLDDVDVDARTGVGGGRLLGQAAHQLFVTREQVRVEVAQDEADGRLLRIGDGRPRVHEPGATLGRLG